MSWIRLKKSLLVLLTGGMLLQSTSTGCGAALAEVAIDLALQFFLSALLGGGLGLAT